MPKVSATAAPAPTAPAPALGIPAGTPSAAPSGAPPPRMASLRPDTFVQTGLADKFNGRVTQCWYVPRKYPVAARSKAKLAGQRYTYAMTLMLVIQADDHSLGDNGIVSEFLRLDDLSQWVPSRTDPQWNGTTWVYQPAGSIQGQPATLENYLALHNGAGFPTGKMEMTKEGQPVLDTNGQPVPETMMLAPEDWWGWLPAPGAQNSREGFKQGTKAAQFSKQLEVLEYHKKAPHINWADLRQFLVGVYGYWVRLPFTFSGGGMPEGAEQQKIDTLCLAEILDLGPVSSNVGLAPVGTNFSAPVTVPAAPVPLQVAAPAPTPVPTPAASTLPATGPGHTQRNDPATVSAATNEILTLLAQGKGGAGLSKQDAGQQLYEQLNGRGLEGALGLTFLNNNEWMGADERTFYWVPAKGMMASTEEIAKTLV